MSIVTPLILAMATMNHIVGLELFLLILLASVIVVVAYTDCLFALVTHNAANQVQKLLSVYQD
jgi:hypothetical protein